LPDLEVHILARLVGVALRQEPLDHLDHLGDVLARLGIGDRRLDAELPDVLHEEARPMAADLPRIAPFPLRLRLDLVLALVGVVEQVPHVGDVHHLAHLEALDLEPAPQRVGEDVRAEVADVRPPVDGRSAVVHAHHARLEGLEGLLATGQGVVDDEAHAVPPGA
jgi:hypothetical protein